MPSSYQKPVENELTYASRLKERQYNDLACEVIPVILHEDDINFMSYSVENRHHFCQTILEHGMTLNEFLIRGGRQKNHLRLFLNQKDLNSMRSIIIQETRI